MYGILHSFIRACISDHLFSMLLSGIGPDKEIFMCKILIIFLPIVSHLWFGDLKEPSH